MFLKPNRVAVILVFTLISLAGYTGTPHFISSFETRAQAVRYIDSLNREAYTQSPAHMTAAGETSRHALLLSDKYLYPIGKIDALNNMAIVERNQGHYAVSLKYLKKSLLLAFKVNKKEYIGQCYYHMGDLYKTMGNYAKGYFYFQHAFYLFKSSKSWTFASMSLGNLAHTHLGEGLSRNDTTYFVKVRRYYLASIKIGEEYNLPQRVVIGYVNLSNLYNVYGTRTKNDAHIATSLDYSHKSYNLAKQYNFKSQMAVSLINIGEIMESRNLPDSALHYYHQALNLYEHTAEANWIVFVRYQIARLYYQGAQYEKAIECLSKCLEVAKKENFKENLLTGNQLMADIYAGMKQYDKALAFYKLSSVFKDSLAVEKNNILKAGMQMEFEADQKDKEIALLNKNKELQSQALKLETIYRNVLIVGCCLLSLLLIWVDYRYREKQRTAIKILKAKEEAEKAKEVQEQFLTNTSHEIRTPMNGVLGMTNYLLETDLNEKQREYVNAINESANNLLVIINDLLDMSKIKAGKMTFVHRPFALKSLFKQLSLILDDKVKEKNILFEFSINEGVPESVIGDRVRVQQVLLNLAGNAVKFTEKGKVSIHINAVKTENNFSTLRFSVIDTGIGIPAENLSTIFESFTQVDAKKNRKHGGTGLGLSISKQLVEQMGGTIQVFSQPGTGSTFYFDLSFEMGETVSEKTGIAEHKPASKNLSGIHVLVVDDNKINRQVAKLTLEKWFVQVHLAEGGKEAIAWLNNNPKVDLILMDITMPGMDGFETTHYIRSHYASPIDKVPIIAMTASAIAGDRDKCLSMGMTDYISKPFKPVELFDLVQKNLPQHATVFKPENIDLSALFEKADGNTEFLADILETYVNEMPGYLDELNDSYSKNDLKAIREQAHKMKSPTALFGAFELKDHLHFIELNIEKSGRTAELEERLRLINSLGEKSIVEVKKELGKMLQAVN